MKDTEGVLLAPKRVLTPVARAIYTNLLEPGEYEGKTAYDITLIFEKESSMKELQQAVLYAAKEKFGNKLPDLKKTFRNGNEKVDSGGPDAFENRIFIHPKSNNKPQTGYKKSGKFIEITNPDEIYWGMWVRATVTAYGYDKKGNKGVAFALNNVLKVRDGEPIGWANGEMDFEACGDSDVDLSGEPANNESSRGSKAVSNDEYEKAFGDADLWGADSGSDSGSSMFD